MFKGFSRNELISIFVTGIMFLVVLFSWFMYSYFEARAYNNVTGKNVSAWDAMFLELRVVND